MPECYLIALAGGSSVDSISNNFTLFSLIEEVQIAKKAFPADSAQEVSLPFEMHAQWLFSSEEQHLDYEIRFVLNTPSRQSRFTEVHPLKAARPRVRIRLQGLPPLSGKEPGNYEIWAELRKAGSTSWARSKGFWPLVVTVSEA